MSLRTDQLMCGFHENQRSHILKILFGYKKFTLDRYVKAGLNISNQETFIYLHAFPQAETYVNTNIQHMLPTGTK